MREAFGWRGWLAAGGVSAMVAVSAALVPTQLPPAIPAAPVVLHLPSARDCFSCTVEVTRVATIGHDIEVGPGRDSRVARDSAGHYVVPVEPGPRIALYDSAGKFVRLIPEWTTARSDRSARGIEPVVDGAGNLFAFDGSRVSWLSFRGVRDTSMARRHRPVEYPAGYQTLTGNAFGWMVTPAATSQPHAVFVAVAHNQANGSTLKQRFAVDSVASSTACRDCPDVVTADAWLYSKSALFTASADRSQIDYHLKWGDSLVHTITIDRPWFPAGSAIRVPGRALPEAPRLTGLAFDVRGCERDAEPPAWLPGPSTCERSLWVSALTIADGAVQAEDGRYATVIDVLGFQSDMRTLRILGERRVPGRLHLFGPGLAYQHRQLPNGDWVIDVFRFTVKS